MVYLHRAIFSDPDKLQFKKSLISAFTFGLFAIICQTPEVLLKNRIPQFGIDGDEFLAMQFWEIARNLSISILN